MFGRKSQEVRDIEDYANNEMNYEGADLPEVGYEGDEFEFGGGDGFATEANADQSFQFTLENKGASAVAREVALWPGMFTAEADLNTAGYPVDGILRDGGVIPGAAADAQITATSGNPTRTINAMIDFMRKNPSRLIAMTIQSDDPDQFDSILNLAQYSPFKDLGKSFIRLQDFYDPDQFSSKKIEMNLLKTGQAFQFDDQAIATLKILAGRKVTFTFFFGAINNQAKKLSKRARRFHSGYLRQLRETREIAK